MNKRKSRLLILLSVIVAMILCVGVFCACEKDEITYSVMLPSGEHYTVTSSNIVKASRGGDVTFDVNIADGYTLYSTSSGAYKDNKLLIDNVKYDMTIIFDVRKKANITYDTPNAKVEITPIMNGELIVGEKAHLSAVANENYNLESLTINGKTIDLAPIYGGGGIPSKVVEIVLEENNLVKAITLGDEYAFTISSNDLGTLTSSNTTNSCRYGDKIKVTALPNDGNRLGFWEINGNVVLEKDSVDIVVEGEIKIYAYFCDSNVKQIIYDANGGNFEQRITSAFYQGGDYFNIDNCLRKITNNGYTLTGLNTKADGSGESHVLGAMVEMPESNLVLYAEWKKQTSKEYFEYIPYNKNGEVIEGRELEADYFYIRCLSPLGMQKDIGELVLPYSYKGAPIKGVAKGAFKGNNSITHVVFHDNITNVDGEAFANCSRLAKITVTENLGNVVIGAWSNSPLNTVRANATKGIDYNTNNITRLGQRFQTIKSKNRNKMVIVVSGSSAENGISRQPFLDELGEEVFGISHIAVNGSRYMLNVLAHNVKAGDTVVMTPEYYDAQFLQETAEAVFANFYWLQTNYDLMEDIDFIYCPRMLDAMFGLWRDKNSGGSPSERESSKNYYSGYYEFYLAGQHDGWNLEIQKIEMNENLIEEESFRILDLLADTIKGSAGRFYYSFPPVNSDGMDDWTKDINNRKKFVNKLEKVINGRIPIISDIENYHWRGSKFRDSNYHLSTEGGRLRSIQLAKDIKAQLAKEGKG